MIPEVRKPHECLILAYHRINESRQDALSVNTRLFRRHLEHLLETGYRNVTLEEVAARIRCKEPSPGRCFALTFDDGYRDNYTDALPVLKDLGCQATFFLAADYIGANRPFPWDVGRFAWVGPADYAMDEREVGALVDAGMSLGSHTCSHPLLATLDAPRVWHEVEQSKVTLERRFGVSVRTFCYPAGSLNDGVVACVARAGYVAGVVTPPRPGIPETLFTLKRVGVYHGTTLPRLRLRLNPLYSRVRGIIWEWKERRSIPFTQSSTPVARHHIQRTREPGGNERPGGALEVLA
ncbi:polysaccharide deacetylase family protein [Anaeromyxobacter terrae]|uniref:polysaccharide deacetylase family protein n=1 Tax=Anaeromyxobacter terrae TaxID=2925406 RepID=UPI001F58707E|nr:polysaccharide deacetylase family protein [Anaeromyxobacter sp. SG22]